MKLVKIIVILLLVIFFEQTVSAQEDQGYIPFFPDFLEPNVKLRYSIARFSVKADIRGQDSEVVETNSSPIALAFSEINILGVENYFGQAFIEFYGDIAIDDVPVESDERAQFFLTNGERESICSGLNFRECPDVLLDIDVQNIIELGYSTLIELGTFFGIGIGIGLQHVDATYTLKLDAEAPFDELEVKRVVSNSAHLIFIGSLGTFRGENWKLTLAKLTNSEGDGHVVNFSREKIEIFYTIPQLEILAFEYYF